MKRLSVIICTYNRRRYIYKAIKSIVDQDYGFDRYEILLIDNNSTDRTDELCRQAMVDFPQADIKYFLEVQQGLSYARNRGIAESRGETVVFVDDDATLIGHRYLQAIDDFFETCGDAAACGGPIIPVFEQGRPAWLSHYTEQLIGGALYMGNQTVEFKQGKYPGGGNSAYRKTVFDRCGLFNPELGRKGNGLLGAEEKDLYYRMTQAGIKFYYLPKMAIYHYIPQQKTTFEHLRNLSIAIGKSERIRTQLIGDDAFKARKKSEVKKWLGTLALFFFFLLTFRPQKGWRLLQFRWYVTKGLRGKDLKQPKWRRLPET